MRKGISLGALERLSFILLLMIAQNFTNDSAMGFFASAYAIYFLLRVLLVDGIETAVSKMVSMRIYKGFKRNATQVIFTCGSYAMVSGGIVLLLFFFAGKGIVTAITGSLYPEILLQYLGILFVFYSLNKVMYGCYLGNARPMAVNLLRLLHIILNLLVGPFAVIWISGYGQKVADLLKLPLYKGVYENLSIILLQILFEIICLVVLSIGQIHYNRKPENNAGNDENTLQSRKKILGNFLILLFAGIKNQFFTRVFPAVICLIFLNVKVVGMNDAGAKLKFLGSVFIKFFCVLYLVFLFFKEFANREKYRMHLDLTKGNAKSARIRTDFYLKNTIFLLLPVCTILIFLADPFTKIFFAGEYKASVFMLRTGGILLLFMGMAYVLQNIISVYRKWMLLLFADVIPFIISVVLYILLSGQLQGSLLLVVIFLLFFLVQIGIYMVYMIRNMHLEWQGLLIRLGKTAASCMAVAVVAIILDRFILMNVAIYLISCILCFLLFFMVMMALHGISEREAQSLKDTWCYASIHYMMQKFRIR